MQRQQDSGFDNLSMKDSFNLLNILCNGLESCVVVFLRTGFGKEYPGLAGLVGLIMMVCYASFARVPGMLPYIGVWLVAVILQRIKTFAMIRKGVVVHSRYWGYPRLAFMVPFVRKEKTARNVIEPWLCSAIGVALSYWSPGVGGFVFIAGWANAIAGAIVVEVNRKKLQAMRDAEIEQRHLAAMYRGEIEEL
jgi:hypothetical protein